MSWKNFMIFCTTIFYFVRFSLFCRPTNLRWSTWTWKTESSLCHRAAPPPPLLHDHPPVPWLPIHRPFQIAPKTLPPKSWSVSFPPRVSPRHWWWLKPLPPRRARAMAPALPAAKPRHPPLLPPPPPAKSCRSGRWRPTPAPQPALREPPLRRRLRHSAWSERLRRPSWRTTTTTLWRFTPIFRKGRPKKFESKKSFLFLPVQEEKSWNFLWQCFVFLAVFSWLSTVWGSIYFDWFVSVIGPSAIFFSSPYTIASSTALGGGGGKTWNAELSYNLLRPFCFW